MLEVADLNLGFVCECGFRQTLYDVSFCVKDGEMLALVGESGCGKSITAMSMLRLLPKNAKLMSGKVMLNGINLMDLSEHAFQKFRGSKIALIPQDPMTSLNPLYTIENQLLEVLAVHQNLYGVEAKQKALEALEMVQIPCAKERLKNYPHEFSGGMKQRAIIAMALACHAEVLIADEPTTALDVTIQAQIMKILREIKQEKKVSVIFITHDLALVSENADNVSVMYAGRIVEEACSDDFFHAPNHPYSKALLNAIPSNRAAKPEAILGQPPTIQQDIAGCKFHPRCKYCMEICTQQVPQFSCVGDKHASACWLNRDNTIKA